MLGRKFSAILLTLILTGVFTLSFNVQNAMAPATRWNKTYGGTYGRNDYARSVVQTADGGFALAGSTQVPGINPSHDPDNNAWLVKTDANGNAQWNRTYGGTDSEDVTSMIVTSDGYYLLAGSTRTWGSGGSDAWLVKIWSNGNIRWSRWYGGTSNDEAWCVVQTSDGGYAFAGHTASYSSGSYDFWLVKTDADGNMQWNHHFGGTEFDVAYSLVQTGDGGYALAGVTQSFGAGGSDFWLVKTDANGNYQWDKTYGSPDCDEEQPCLIKTSDGGYALAGRKVKNIGSLFQSWLVKTDAGGKTQWTRTYGGTGDEGSAYVHSLIQTSDGGYAMAGWATGSTGDGLLVKTDAGGNFQWSKTHGGTCHDSAWSLIQTSDGGYALAGSTSSFGVGHPYMDFWLIKEWSVPPFPAYVVVEGSDNGIWYRAFDSWTEIWGSWNRLPGATSYGPAATVGYDKLYMVVKGNGDNRLWYGSVDLGTNGFSGWTLLDGATPSPPVLTSGRLNGGSLDGSMFYLVVRGMDNRIYYRSCVSNSWDTWHAVPTGATDGGPGAVTLGDNLHIVVRGMDGNSLWHIIVNPDTGAVIKDWTLLSGSTPSKQVLAASPTTGKLYLVVRGMDNRIYYRTYNDFTGTWGIWVALPGATIGGPAATVSGNMLDLVVRGMDGNTLWHGHVNLITNQFSGWYSFSGSTPMAPTLTS